MALTGKALKFYEIHHHLHEMSLQGKMYTAQEANELKERMTKLFIDTYDLNPASNFGWFNDLMNAVKLPYRIYPTNKFEDLKDGTFALMIDDRRGSKDQMIQHIYMLCKLFKHTKEDVDGMMESDFVSFQRLFTILYDMAFRPFFPFETGYIYTIYEINQLLYHRRFPYYVRILGYPGQYGTMYQVVDVEWKG